MTSAGIGNWRASTMNRYSMIVTNGSYREIESDTGEWVRYKDVVELLKSVEKKEQFPAVLGEFKMLNKQAS